MGIEEEFVYLTTLFARGLRARASIPLTVLMTWLFSE